MKFYIKKSQQPPYPQKDNKFSLLNHQVFNNESGFVLVMSMLILIVLVLLGLSGSNTSLLETEISRNDRFHKMAFYNAEAGVWTTPKLISSTIDSSAAVTGAALGSVTYLDSEDSVFREIMGFDPLEADDPDPTDDRDLTFTLSPGGINYTVNVNIQRLGSYLIKGGGVEFGSGYEGIGTGSTGGTVVKFQEDSYGGGPRTTTSHIEAGYSKAVGVPGGL